MLYLVHGLSYWIDTNCNNRGNDLPIYLDSFAINQTYCTHNMKK